MRIVYSLFLVFVCSYGFAQHIDLDELHPKNNYANIHVQKLYSDSLSSTFAIWVKQSVKPHFHSEHTEVITVLQGRAIMTLGDSSFKIKKGSIVIIPKKSIHSVQVTSKKPLLVLSVQAPEFTGQDRTFVNEY